MTGRGGDTTGMTHAERTGLTARADFRRGFIGMMPLWVAAIPSGIAFGVAARGAGLGAIEAQLMSLLIFSAAGQVGALALLADPLPRPLVIGAVMALNAQLLLLGLAAGRQLRPRWPVHLGAAFFLTDAAFAVAAAGARLRLATLTGAGVSMYLAWNGGTALGLLLGRRLLAVRDLGIDFVLPLIFLALAIPTLRSRAACGVALIAGLGTLALGHLIPSSLALLLAGTGACLCGAWWTRHPTTAPQEADR
jgi:predicted branched-subunit amino acid permease